MKTMPVLYTSFSIKKVARLVLATVAVSSVTFLWLVHNGKMFHVKTRIAHKNVALQEQKKVILNELLFNKTDPLDCSLTKLRSVFATDDDNPGANEHYFTQYERNLCKFRQMNKPFTLVEIGRGYGSSTWLWYEYFQKATIASLDVAPWPSMNTTSKYRNDRYKRPPKDRVHLVNGSQDDITFLKSVCDTYKDIGVVIDDGSHFTKHIFTSFYTLFPCMIDGGVYVIEDTILTYDPIYAGHNVQFCNMNSNAHLYGNFTFLALVQNYHQLLCTERKNKWMNELSAIIAAVTFQTGQIYVEKGPNPKPQHYPPD